LGANALLNKRIMSSLSEWKSVAWRLRCVTAGVPPRSVYGSTRYRTVDELRLGARPLFLAATSGGQKDSPTPVECSVFERHAMHLTQEAIYAARLENTFAEGDESASSSNRSSSAAVRGLFRGALAAARQQGSASASSSSSGAAGGQGEGGAGARSRDAALQGMSLQDLISSVMEDASGRSGDAGGSERSSRFALAAEFSQESTVVIGSGEGNAATDLSGRAPGSGGAEGADSSLDSAAAAGRAAAGGLGGASEEDLLGTEDGAPSVAGGYVSRRQAAASASSAAKKARQELEEREREEELEALRAQLQASAALVEALERQKGDALARQRQMESEVSSLHSAAEEVEREILLKRKTLEMLPSAKENILALQNICAASAKKLMVLAQEWETHRRPLVDRLREVNSHKARRRAQCKQMVEEMKRWRAEMVTMMQDLKDKQERAQVLQEELSKMPKNINRTLYTYRIMDIIASIGKQNKEITKITNDIRDIQKTINSSTSTLQRADAIAEEKIYAAATGATHDNAMVDAYRQLKNLRSKFEDLVGIVNKIGAQDKQSADLETKIDQEQTRVSSNNMDRIKADLDQIKAENAQLVAQIKSVSGGK
jgi:hypothetical protein